MKMTFLERLSNYLYLLKLKNTKLEFFDEIKAKNWIRNALQVAKNYKKRSWTRNELVKHIKQIRSQFPYQVEDYTEAKRLYEQYNEVKGHIDYDKLLERLKKGAVIYITKFTDRYPIKGERYSEYSISVSVGGDDQIGRAIKLYYDDKRDKVVCVHSNKPNSIVFYYDRDYIKQYRFALKKEIRTFWAVREQLLQLIRFREYLNEELRKVVNEIYSL